MADRKITIKTLREKVAAGQKISMLAAYDYPTAAILEQAGIDSIIVGDSVAMAVYGMDNTLEMTMDTMIGHTAAVARAAPNVFLIGDMPYMSYQPSIEQAIQNAGRFLAQGRADAIKLEGGRNVIDTTRALVKATIPVVGHIGFTPQSEAQLGGVRVMARAADYALELVRDAMALQEAGVCMLIIECVPPAVTTEIVRRCNVPVIGIGSGPDCHGFVLLLHDILGLFTKFKPKFVKRYANLTEQAESAVRQYIAEVTAGQYPAAEHCYSMPKDQQQRFEQLLTELKDM